MCRLGGLFRTTLAVTGKRNKLGIVTLAEILARTGVEKGSGIPPESRPAPRISGRVYTHLPPCILVLAYTAVPLDP